MELSNRSNAMGVLTGYDHQAAAAQARQNAPMPVQPDFIRWCDEISALKDRMRDLGNGLSRLADNLFGALPPSPIDDDAPKADPRCQIEALEFQLRWLDQAVCDAEEQFRRFQRLA